MNPLEQQPGESSTPRTRGELLKLLKIAAAAIAALLLWFVLQPLDIGISALFYRPGSGFFLDHADVIQLIYHGTRWLVDALVLLLLAAFFYALLPTSKWPPAWRGRIAFLLLSLAIGPGLITNTLLKDHLGRPRPVQIGDFGGKGHYVAPLIPSTQCRRNCSFPSGHAAAGFWLISGAWVWQRRRRSWLLLGCAVGGIVGLARIAQGGHFFSDVLAALAVVWLTNILLSRWMLEHGWLRPLAGSLSLREPAGSAGNRK